MGPMWWVSVASWTTIATPSPLCQKQLTRINRIHFRAALQTLTLTLDTSPSLRKAYGMWVPDTEITQIHELFSLQLQLHKLWVFFTLGWSTGVQRMRLSQVNLVGLFTPFLCMIPHFSLLKPLHSSIEYIASTTPSDTGKIHNCRKITNSCGHLRVNFKKLKRDQLII